MYEIYKLSFSLLPEGTKHFYYNSRKGYVLLFDKEGLPFQKAEIKELDAEERRWLFRCKTSINGQAMKDNEEDYSSILDDFLNRFEEELKKEAKAE